jgi:hypothetical protein
LRGHDGRAKLGRMGLGHAVRRRSAPAAIVTLCLIFPPIAGAQDVDVERIRALLHRSAAARDVRLTLPADSDRVDARTGLPPLSAAARAQSGARQQRRSVGRVILGAAVGTVGGFFAGGYLGAKIEGNDCNCDDPGFKGFLIGAPIGAVAGGILGGLFLF